MGVFKHEAAAVDPRGRRVYLTEDVMDGALYRFTPRRWPDLGEGLLELARVDARRGGRVGARPGPLGAREATRRRCRGATEFARAEGIWFDSGTVYVATTGDSRIHAYDTRRRRLEVIYDGLASREAPLLRVDNITASRAGELFVCEDISTEEIDMGVMTRARRVARFLSVTGRNHAGSELDRRRLRPSGAGSTSPPSAPTGSRARCTRSPAHSAAGAGARPGFLAKEVLVPGAGAAPPPRAVALENEALRARARARPARPSPWRGRGPRLPQPRPPRRSPWRAAGSPAASVRPRPVVERQRGRPQPMATSVCPSRQARPKESDTTTAG